MKTILNHILIEPHVRTKNDIKSHTVQVFRLKMKKKKKKATLKEFSRLQKTAVTYEPVNIFSIFFSKLATSLNISQGFKKQLFSHIL